MVQPPDPVRFDVAAAEAAIREVSLTAGALIEVATVLEYDAQTSADGWSGPTRYTFDVESARHDLTARSLAQTLEALAVQIAMLRYEAQAETQRRWTQYRADVDAEQRARAAANRGSGPP